jgi:hypothetical protein
MTVKDGFKFGIGFMLARMVIESLDGAFGSVYLKSEFHKRSVRRRADR